MAFPSVAGRTTSSTNSTSTTHTVSLPASIAAGDRLVAVAFSTSTATTWTWPGGWTEAYDTNGLSVAERIADGSEGASISVTSSNNVKATHLSFRITGADAGAAVQVSTEATGSSGAADPPNLTPTGGPKDFLWLAIAGTQNTNAQTYSVAPTNYSNLQSVESTGGLATSNCDLASAERQLNATSENPGTFTNGPGSQTWRAVTVAVHGLMADLSGAIPAVSSVTGDMAVAVAISGSVAAVSSVGPSDLTSLVSLAGSVDATTSVGPSDLTVHILAGSVAAQSSASATIAILATGNADTFRPPRWLLAFDDGAKTVRLSDIAGEVQNQLYYGGVESVQVAEIKADVEQWTISNPSATISLAPNIARLIDPMNRLSEWTVTLTAWDGSAPHVILVAKPEDVEVGLPGEPITFRLVETFKKNPDFPPKIVDGTTINPNKLIATAEGRVFPVVVGNAYAVPTFKVQQGSRNTRYMVCGHPLAAGDPCPYETFPNPTYPDDNGGTPNIIKGGFVGPNQILRDNFNNSELLGGWSVVSGTWSETTFLSQSNTATGPHILKWDLWDYSDSLSIAVRYQPVSTIANRLMILWNVEDANNWSAVIFRIYNTSSLDSHIAYQSRASGSDLEQSTFNLGPVMAAGAQIYTVDIKDGTLSVSYQTGPTNFVKHSFGTGIATVNGKVGIGTFEGSGRFTMFRMPSMEPVSVDPVALPNQAISYQTDQRMGTYVADIYRQELTEPLYYNFRKARGTKRAGGLMRRLIEEYSEYTAPEIDQLTLDTMRERLRPFVIGAYFNEQAPLFDVIRDRLSPQFLTFVTQQGGKIRTFAFDPEVPIERELKRGFELIDQAGPVRQLPRFTRFKVQARYFAPRQTWQLKEKNVPQNTPALESIEAKSGRRDYPKVNAPDIIKGEGVKRLVNMLTRLLHDGKEVAYLQRMSEFGDLPWGFCCGLTDENFGWNKKKAILVARKPVTPEYVINTYRTIEEISLG